METGFHREDTNGCGTVEPTVDTNSIERIHDCGNQSLDQSAVSTTVDIHAWSLIVPAVLLVYRIFGGPSRSTVSWSTMTAIPDYP